MRILVLGASGMLGHKLVQVFAPEFETVAAVRRPDSCPVVLGAARIVCLEANDLHSIVRVLDRVQPRVVLNALGVVKQAPAERAQVIAVNALFPNQLAELCSARAIRLVHYSTDCVFSGARHSIRGLQGYRECDPTDARDLYGLSKLLGELEGGAHLTLRTSMIGRELRGRTGLVEWFLSQRGPVRGFQNALFSGLTTLELARLTLALVRDHPALSGLWHVAGHPISKHDLLVLIKRAYDVPTDIVPDESFHCDRRLDGSRFSQATGWRPRDWRTLVGEMREDPFTYGAAVPARRLALPGA